MLHFFHKVYSVVGILSLSLLFLATFLTRPVQAENSDTVYSEDHLLRISSNCMSAQKYLNDNVLRSDALAYNQSQRYTSLSVKMMSPMDARLAGSGLETVALIRTADSYSKQLVVFRDAYSEYQKTMVGAVGSSRCITQPKEFYDAVQLARVRRQEVYQSVVVLKSLLEEYKIEYNEILTKFHGAPL